MSVERAQVESAGEEDRLSRSVILLLATATGLAVANLYYAQPLLADIAQSFRASEGQAGLVVTLGQAGYAVGLALLVPLGDILERRILVPIVLLGAALALALAAVAPSITLLAVIAALIGLTSVVAQILVPFAADLASSRERGRVVGTVMSGLLIGILLARTASGIVAGIWSWRAVFGAAALLMAALGGVLWKTLPSRPPNAPLPYPALLRSILTLVRSEPTLRRRSFYGALGFGAFNVFWTTVAFMLAGPPYHYGVSAIGAFGLVGAAGAFMASMAGRLADRGLTTPAGGAFAVSIATSFLLLFAGAGSLPLLVAGIVLLDIGTQGMHITNQSVTYRLNPGARSRLTTAYMTSNFAGGALGSAASVVLYEVHGWGAVCLLGGILGGVLCVAWLSELLPRTEGRPS